MLLSSCDGGVYSFESTSSLSSQVASREPVATLPSYLPSSLFLFFLLCEGLCSVLSSSIYKNIAFNSVAIVYWLTGVCVIVADENSVFLQAAPGVSSDCSSCKKRRVSTMWPFTSRGSSSGWRYSSRRGVAGHHRTRERSQRRAK